jgi:hypothetical protein
MARQTTPADLPQSPQLRAYLDAFEAIKVEAARLAADVPADRFNRRPGPERWSAAECFDHLTRTGSLLLPHLDAGIQQGRAQGRTAAGPFRYGPFSRYFIRAMQPGSKKVRTVKAFAPAAPSGLEKDRVVADLLALQDAFQQRIRAADGLDLKRILVRSGASPLIRLGLGAWFEATLGHERRHLDQARRAVDE